MYEGLKVFFSVGCIILGLLYIFIPKLVTKKESREDPRELKKVRLMGGIMFLLGLLIVALDYYKMW